MLQNALMLLSMLTNKIRENESCQGKIITRSPENCKDKPCRLFYLLPPC